MLDDNIMVSVECLAYNQEKYIRKALDGFISQKTNFRYEVIVHDDASTDGTSEIIMEYAQKYPDIIVPIIEKENQYSKHDDSITKVIEPLLRGKYVAYCEGDDYWCDPFKLQAQFDFMESHPEHTLCFHAFSILYNDGMMNEIHRYSSDNEICSMKDIILGGGGYMTTNSMFYRRNLRDSYPQWAKRAPVSDLPWILVFSSLGKVGYIDRNMSVYRYMADGSWSSRVGNDFSKYYAHRRIMRRLYFEYNSWTNYKYFFYILLRQIISDLSILKRFLIFIARNK